MTLVLAEDTRVTHKLLAHLGATAKLTSCHKENEQGRVAQVVEALQRGEDVALCTDAGSPAVSDPGAQLVAAVHEAGLRVVPLPGPSAVATALSASGFEGTGFRFAGFLPRKGEERAEALATIANSREPVILFESPNRTSETLADLARACGPERLGLVARELTKLYEEVVRAPLGELAQRFAGEVRGEVTLVISAAAADSAASGPVSDDHILAALAARPEAERLRDRVDAVAAALHVPRRRVYQLAVGA